ncbi:peptide ABC transporter substrate-binding protein [Sporosarcina thermotolerans]|uniref:Peptide ABC transporter substrate-binding protein n=1 Tax=Sporosarcina thermotolerans TaxID=633404 RepID=A0AAW9A885_9BACL|nr:peptide ABC transporter substrate-binding protein [Sporosarcina thermotolerans]MDW0117249.1 peptide ABC transporter substrate-binding protein [Sporosarcina thermotolerans]WHT47414.1 peptide ABC transporter substrate-binding protein [Sporosarcina thermotolerans]
MKRNKMLLLLTLSLVLSVVLAACGGKDKSEDKNAAPNKENDKATQEEVSEPDAEQVLNLIEAAAIPSVDSAIVEDAVGFNVLNNVNEGLYRLNLENVAEPAIAAEEAVVSEDGLTYTFKLRDAKWSDGSEVTAHDFVFAWQRAIDPDTGSPYGPFMMSGVVKNATAISEGDMDKSELGIVAEDDKTLVVTLERPVPYFLSLMSFGTFYPQKEEFVTAKGDAYATNSDNLLYNGPFVLTEWDGTGDSWVYKKNENYWDAENVKLETINVDVVKDSATAIKLYNDGKKDRAGVSGDLALQYSSHAEAIVQPETSVFYMKFNQEKDGKETPLANVNIRKAIAKSFEKQDLADVILANGSIPADFIVPKDFAFDENGKDFRDIGGDHLVYDAEEAKDFWQKGLDELGVTELELEILGGDTELSKKMDEYFKSQLESNLEGLKIKLKEVPFSVRLELDTNQQYDIQISGWGPDFQDPISFLDMFVTDGTNNLMSYSNPEYDALIEASKAELALDPVARYEAFAKAEKILLEDDAAIAPIYQRGLLQLQKPYFKGLAVHPFGADYSYKWAYISGK